MRKIVFIISAAALALVACGQAASPAAQPTNGITAAPSATVVEQPSAAPPAPTSQPTTIPEPTAPATTPGQAAGAGQSVRPPDALVHAAQQRLARHLGVAADGLALQSANAREWPDGSLGCPAAGNVYPQVVTPGFLLVFSNPAQSRTYEVHTAQSEAQMVLCENGKPADLSTAQAASGAPTSQQPAAAATTLVLDETSKQMADLAQAALATQLGVKASDVTLIAAEATEWNDSSLGCPQPGQAYLQVITPGYKMTLEAQGKRYEYHTDTRRRVVRCDKAAP
jgi:hypothetical protein